MDVYQRLMELGLKLPPAPARGGVYAPAKKFAGGLVYVSGCGPSIGGVAVQGKLGCEFTLEQGQEYARNCMLNVLAVLESCIGDLNRVKNVVKITTFVASADDFYNQPKVANGGSSLLVELFGEEAGAPSRSAIGVNVLPGNIPVETEALFECDLV
ncbi:MAG TPA: RidA family protein [Clostridiales bacterium]|nr:RidA family protein [Clostridiales bacterium]